MLPLSDHNNDVDTDFEGSVSEESDDFSTAEKISP